MFDMEELTRYRPVLITVCQFLANILVVMGIEKSKDNNISRITIKQRRRRLIGSNAASISQNRSHKDAIRETMDGPEAEAIINLAVSASDLIENGQSLSDSFDERVIDDLYNKASDKLIELEGAGI